MAIAADAGDVFDQFYRYVEIKNRTFEAHLPGETVDHFTGTLRIIQEDFSFPGKAGLDLKVIRAYSSRIWGRTDLATTEPFLADKDPSPVGLGWTLHMGRLRNPQPTAMPTACGGGDYPIYEAPDGTARTFYPRVGSHTAYTARDYWKLDNNCTTLSGPGACITTATGQRLEFASSARYWIGAAPVWPLTAVVDLFSNRIAVTYQDGLINEITDTWNRTLSFHYSTCANRQCLDTITASDPGGGRRVVRYTYRVYTPAETRGSGQLELTSPGRPFLTGVQLEARPPDDPYPGYSYTYGIATPVTSNQYALSSITYPFGGTTSYTYFTRRFFTGRDDVPMAVVASRTTSGRELPSATWSYDYSAARTTDFQTTTVTRPDMKHDVYEFFGFGFPARINATGNVWKVGLQNKVSRGDSADVEQFVWEKGATITQANYSAPAYGAAACPTWSWDTEVQSPVLTKRTVTRDGASYVTEMSGHDQYGQPGVITESGEARGAAAATTKRVKTYAYDYDSASNQVLGRVASEQVCQGSGTSDCYVNTRTFNGVARRLDSETLRGVTSTFTYWPDGQLRTVTNALGQTMTIGYTMGYGIPTSIDYNGAYSIGRTAYWDGSLKSESNGRGDITSYTYDGAGRLKTVTPPGPNDAATYVYAPDGSSYSVTRGSGATLFTETTTLDGLGRTIGTGNSLSEQQTFEFDSMGRLAFKSYPFGSTSGEAGDKFEYDELGRPTTTSRRFVATGHRPLTGQCADAARCYATVSYSPTNHCRTLAVDRAPGDRVRTQTCFESFADLQAERLVTLTDGKSKAWRYDYDVAGNLKTLTAPQPAGNHTFTYKPSTFFQESSISAPRGTTRIRAHNAVGQPLTQIDARKITTTFEYVDRLSRLTLTRYETGGPHDVVRTYDRDTLKTVSSQRGGTYTYGYDELNRVTSQTWEFGVITYTTIYKYDSSGCLWELTYPTGTTIRMTCDAKGRTASVKRVVTSGAPVTIADQITYHPLDRPASIVYGNGRTVTTTLENGRLKSLGTPGVLDLTYTYDGADNVKSVTDAITASSSLPNLTYDELDRLLTVQTSAGNFIFSYDDLGNRKQKVVPGQGTTTFTYDPNTNQLSWSTGPGAPPPIALTWTPAERLESSSDGATYSYDGLGRRVAMQAAGVDVVYHYDKGGRLLAETQLNGAPIREYYYVGRELIGVEGCINGFATGCGERQWYHTDALGNVLRRTDSTGSVVGQTAYDSWGETPPGASGTRLFNGRALDAGTGLYDFGARMYSPDLGRFVSSDQAAIVPANPPSANLYAFAFDNPKKYIDRTGSIPDFYYEPREPHATGPPQVILENPTPNVRTAVNFLKTNYPGLFPQTVNTVISVGDPGAGNTAGTGEITGFITIRGDLSPEEMVQDLAHELLHSRLGILDRSLMKIKQVVGWQDPIHEATYHIAQSIEGAFTRTRDPNPSEEKYKYYGQVVIEGSKISIVGSNNRDEVVQFPSVR
jgi:RHS repeat-associated protein